MKKSSQGIERRTDGRGTRKVETNPIPQAVPLLDSSYRVLFEMMYTELMAQTHLKTLLEEITFTWDAQAGQMQADASLALADIAATNDLEWRMQA
jgi:hypothetical protein